MARIFAITGAQKTGKTTLKGLIGRDDNSEFVFPPSPGEYAREQGVPIGKAGTDQTHVFFAKAHVKNLVSVVDEGQTLFLDRCLIDHLAYVRLLSDDDKLIEMNEALVALSAKLYNTVFLTKINLDFAPESDAHEDTEFRLEVQSQIFQIAEQYGFPYIGLSPDLNIAFDQIAEALKK